MINTYKNIKNRRNVQTYRQNFGPEIRSLRGFATKTMKNGTRDGGKRPGMHLFLIHVVELRLGFVVLEVGERSGLDTDVEAPRAVESERYPREGHLPAVEVARNGHRGGGQLTLLDVVTALEGDTRFGGEVDRTVETEGLGDVLPISLGRDLLVRLS